MAVVFLEPDLVAGQFYQVFDITSGNVGPRIRVDAAYNPDTDVIAITSWQDFGNGVLIEVNSHFIVSSQPQNRFFYFTPGLYTLAQMSAAAHQRAALMAAMGGAGAAMGGAGAAAGGLPVFTNAAQLLEGAEHKSILKPDYANSLSMTEFKVGDPVIIIYEGGEAAVPQIFKRAGLLAYFNHELANGVQHVKNPLTNTVIINAGQPLPVPDAHGRRIFNNGVIIKTGNIIGRDPYPLRSSKKPRRSRNRKSRRNATRHRKNRKPMY